MARVHIEFTTTPDDSQGGGPPPGSADWNRAYLARSSEIAFLMGRFFVEHMVRLHREFDGDLELPILLGEIAHHNVSRRRSIDGSIVEEESAAGLPVGEPAGLLPCNAFSISQATGIPRETVRRKVDALVKRGWLTKSAQGEIVVARAAGDHFRPEFNRQTLLSLLRVAEEVEYLIAKSARAHEVTSAGPATAPHRPADESVELPAGAPRPPTVVISTSDDSVAEATAGTRQRKRARERA